MTSGNKNVLVAGLLGVVAAVLFFSSTADYAYPGASARLIAQWKGLEAGAPAEFPLMAVFAGLLGVGNLIAPVCGVVAAVALYALVSTAVALCVAGEEPASGRRWRLAAVAGAVSVFVFILSPAVRSAATHLEPRLFDFAWLMLAMAVSLPFFFVRHAPLKSVAAVMGAMFGIAVCDSALPLALAPVCLAVAAGLAMRRSRRPYAPMAVFLVVFAAVALFSAKAFGLEFAKHAGALVREARAWTSTPGWVFVASFSALPAVLAFFASRRSFSERPSLVVWIFHCSLSFAAVVAVATPLSPSAILEPYGVLPVASCAMAAVVAGYLAAFWWDNRGSVVAVAAGGVLAFVLAASCLWNLFAFDGDDGAFADQVARRAVADLGDRTWLVTDGVLDSHLRLVADAEGRELHLVSLARDFDEGYRARLSEEVAATGVGGGRNAALRASLTLGVLPFVEDLLAVPESKKSVAVWGAPDLWLSAHVDPVPEFLFFGGDETRTPDWSSWPAMGKILSAPKAWGSSSVGKETSPVARLRLSLRRHVGLVANDRGVWLQDRHRDDDAWKMYELVLSDIDRDNICAVFNELAMLGANHPAAVAKKRDLERMVKAAVDDPGRRYLLWRLGTYYGYIRNPDVFVRLGHLWARSGRPGEAISQIRRAIDFVPAERRTSLLNMMAALYANEREHGKSRRIYEAILAKDGNDHDALIGMMRLELSDGRQDEAIGYLERAVAVAGDGDRALAEAAMLAMMRRDYAGAMANAQKAVDRNPKDVRAWALMMGAAVQNLSESSDPKEKASIERRIEDEILPAMEKAAGGDHDYHLQTAKGLLLLQKGDGRRKEARDAFAKAARSRPDVIATQDIVLGLDISLADHEEAERHATEVLRRDRSAPLANYVMGSLALGRGDLVNAELFLRRAADAAKPVAMAQNDLAEVLRRLKRLDEAEAYARKAVASAPGMYVAWDTLGTILMDRNGGLDEAEACIRKACDLSKDKNGRESDVRMLVSLARVQVLLGDRTRAMATVRSVRRRIGELSAYERQEFERMAKGLK